MSTTLLIDNLNHVSSKSTPITQLLKVDILDVRGQSLVYINLPGYPFTVQSITGDSTGIITFSNGTILNANFPGFWDKNTTQANHLLQSSPTIIISNISVVLMDAIINSTNLLITSRGKLFLSTEGSSLGNIEPGVYNFSRVEINDGGELQFTYRALQTDISEQNACPMNSLSKLYVSELLSIGINSRLHSDEQGCLGGFVSTHWSEYNGATRGGSILARRGGITGELGGSGGGMFSQGGSGLSANFVENSDTYTTYSREIMGSGGGMFVQKKYTLFYLYYSCVLSYA